jgi:chromosome segregation ATPase
MRMTEERMAALQQEYEGRLHDAAITKVLLKKRERQLADMKQQLDYERQRAEEALEREKTWREAKEKAEVEARIRVEETTNHALLMEGRYKALSSHWDEQKEELGRARTKLSKQVQSFRDDMIRDGDKIVSLQQICDEYRTALESERKQKEQISKNFENYKEENENFLAPLKSKLRHQEEEYEGKIAQAQEALNKLQWALGVNENVKGI